MVVGEAWENVSGSAVASIHLSAVLEHQVPNELGAASISWRSATLGVASGAEWTRASVASRRVIVLPVRGLLELQWNADLEGRELGKDGRTNDEYQEEHEHGEVQNGVADNSSSAEFRLLQ